MLVFANRAVEVMFGWAAEELIGQPIERLIPSVFRDGTSPAGSRDLVGRRKDGFSFPIEVTVNHVPTPGGGRTVRVRDRHHRTPACGGGSSTADVRTGIPDDATESDGVGPDARRAPGARADRQNAARRAPAAPGHRGPEPRSPHQGRERGWSCAERAAGRGERAARRSDGPRAVAERRAVSSRAAAFRTSRRPDVAGELDTREGTS